MILSIEHPYTKFFTIWLDGEELKQYFQYDTTRKIIALGKDITAKLLDWDLARTYKAGMTIGESYEIAASLFVRDVEADFSLRFSDKCPSHIKAELLT